ncbi:triphosphoribosyl-dephospho-CoA synthase [Pseudovibrio flavus]|uniref:triphosphoribosyl-dephospho-CoA synthase n=1 Tax=Pseudovibrio flavus TaxID=2529854 RepID=UPI00211C7ED8|nr:triphosphoribosyl-dephospho-CoA synthase [Pseudovibrio flavus]
MSPDEVACRIGAALQQGVLHEVSCTQKPGLVSPESMGAHDDMNHHSFMASSVVLGQSFFFFAQMGNQSPVCDRSLFDLLRLSGPAWETRLMASTRGVNTHRGMLFVGAVVSAAAGYAARYTSELSPTKICSHVSAMAEGLCSRELQERSKALQCQKTAGERLYEQYGMTGIRGEVERGLPSVIDHSLPALSFAFEQTLSLETCLRHALLELMVVVEDTTVVNRGGMEALSWLHKAAGEVLAAGSVFTPAGTDRYRQLAQQCSQRRISPGGCADLLAITIALYLLQTGNWPSHIL